MDFQKKIIHRVFCDSDAEKIPKEILGNMSAFLRMYISVSKSMVTYFPPE